ncbi:hypothetical protein QQP08_024691 [Theobroma cacao]|nr:hypothetical protein QQP08_024691 [Theobroma cacao]
MVRYYGLGRGGAFSRLEPKAWNANWIDKRNETVRNCSVKRRNSEARNFEEKRVEKLPYVLILDCCY